MERRETHVHLAVSSATQHPFSTKGHLLHRPPRNHDASKASFLLDLKLLTTTQKEEEEVEGGEAALWSRCPRQAEPPRKLRAHGPLHRHPWGSPRHT